MMGVLDEVHVPQGEGEVMWVFRSHLFEWHTFLTEMNSACV